MNREHLRAFLWLRWRLRVNQFRKAGPLNAAFFILVCVLAALAALGLLVAGFLVGLLALPRAEPWVQLLVWDGVIAALLFFWMIGLLSDLQRTEGVAIDKVLHLPVSPSGAFLVNYLSTFFSLTLLAFVPGMVGLIVGQVFAGRPLLLLALPLLAAFVLAVTALTYQFQGWLASLMTNPRRRRTVIVFVTAGFILLAQLPNLLNMTRARDGVKWSEELTRRNEQRFALQQELLAKRITPEEYERREKEIAREFDARRAERDRQTREQVEGTARLISLVVPPGWLALGAADLSGGNAVPALLGTLGLGLIGAVSLRRAYRTTLRLYTGEFTGQGKRKEPKTAVAAAAGPGRVRMVEWRLPWVSEHASAVATAALRSLVRAPEAKMMLLAPLIMLVVFGGASISARSEPPAALRPLMAFGAGAMVLLISGVQLIGNQFGYDRTGFRAYVLSPIPRREILIGKNLAVAPLGLGLGLVMLLLVGIVYPMRIDHYPAAVVQLLSVYLLFCMLANVLSIAAPIPLAAGSLQPAQVKLVPVLLQMVFLGVLPIAALPILFPYGVEVLLAEAAGVRGWPVSLALSLVVLVVMVLLYRVVLTWEGNWLAAREKAILEVVTSKE